MFDDIIMNLFSNKSVNQHVKVVYRYFTKTDNNKINTYRGSSQGFYWKKGTLESLDVVHPHLNV